MSGGPKRFVPLGLHRLVPTPDCALSLLALLLLCYFPAGLWAEPAAPEAAPATPPGEASGELLVSIDVRDVDVRDVLWALARQGNVNLALTESVKGRVTIRLKNVAWEDALAMVVHTTGLAYRREAGLVVVMTTAEAQGALGGPVRAGVMETRTIALKHAKIQAVLDAVKAQLSEKGTVVALPETNSLILSDVSEKLKEISSIIAAIDVPPPEEWIKVSSPSPGEYTVTLDVKDVDARDLLWSLARQVNANIILTEGVKGRVTIRLKETPWKNALDTIVQTAGLAYQQEGELFKILLPVKEAVTPEGVSRLVTKVIPIKFAKTEEVGKVVQVKLSGSGQVVPMLENKSLMIVDVPEKIREIEAMLPFLDVAPRQVMIEVVIADMKLQGEQDVGVNWNLVFNKNQTLGVGEQNLEPSRGITVPTQFGQLSPGQVTGEGALAGIQVVRGPWTATALIDLLQQDTDTKILASPKILVLSGKKALIDTIEEIPFQELTQTAQGGQISSVQFKEVGVKLEVLPTITDQGDIILNVKPEQSVRTGEVVAGVPVIDTRKADTTLLMQDGETAIIGGLRRKIQNVQTKMIPGLGKIPFLGKLFRRDDKMTEVRELVVFLIPRLYTGAILTDKDRETLKEMDKVQEQTSIVPK